MFISKRIFFKSKKNGYLLFCGNSNSFYQIDDKNASLISSMIETGDDKYLPDTIRNEFIKTGVLLSESDDDFFYRMKYLSYSNRFSRNYLNLVLAPTMACNFRG